jgi:muramoyltetrapeptide carboxypeptidase
MNRRAFNKLIANGTIALSVVSSNNTGYKKKDKYLRQGDTIGLVAPAGFVDEDRLEKTKMNLDVLGLKYHYSKTLLRKHGYLAGSDSMRLNELHNMYADQNIDGIWCVKGGYGTTRILDYLDFDLIKKNKKPLIGYSDITALLNTIHQKTGSPCFHGPISSSKMTDYTSQYLSPIFGLEGQHNIMHSNDNVERGLTEDIYKFSTINSGVATGDLVGGNLTLLVSLLGTKHEVNTKKKLVFIEDVGEAPYRVDRMLTQLISAGVFNKAKGIIFGIFVGCQQKNEKKQKLQEVIHERIKRLKVPAAYGISFGHTDDQCTFPIGAKATFDADSGIVTLLEDGY